MLKKERERGGELWINGFKKMDRVFYENILRLFATKAKKYCFSNRVRVLFWKC